MKWVSINKKMPDIGQEVLILLEVGGNIERGEYLGHGDFEGNWGGRIGRNECYKVTHWCADLPQFE